jgi:hypothetical protein
MRQPREEEKVPCPYCHVLAGQRCVKASGQPTGQFPHGLRRYLAAMEGRLPDQYIPEESRLAIARWKASQDALSQTGTS